jgi:hypothetical protein
MQQMAHIILPIPPHWELFIRLQSPVIVNQRMEDLGCESNDRNSPRIVLKRYLKPENCILVSSAVNKHAPVPFWRDLDARSPLEKTNLWES